MKRFEIGGGTPPQDNQPAPPPAEDGEYTEGGMTYDCETAKICCSSSDPQDARFEYAKWGDYEGMGISVITAYSFTQQRYRVFLGGDSMDAFAAMVRAHQYVIGFNSHMFDDELIASRGVQLRDGQGVDLLRAVRAAAGLSPGRPSGKGFKMNDIYRVNIPGGVCKTGDGGDAPRLWQQGYCGQVIDYCLNDTQMLTELVMLALAEGTLRNPTDPDGPPLPVRDHLPADLIQSLEWRQAIRPDAE